MQKIAKVLAVALLSLSAQQLFAHTGKTFLADRPKGVDSFLERVTFQDMNASKAEDAFGATFQVTAFYNESFNPGAIGRYFLVNDTNEINLTRDQIRLMIPDYSNASGNATPVSSPNDTTFKLNPSIRTYGLMLSYYQDLEKILPGLYFDVRTPIVEVNADLEAVAAGGNASDLAKFIGGKLAEIQTTEPNARQPLQSLIYDGPTTAIGIADIDLRLGYAFLQKQNGWFGMNLGLTIPTGNQPESKQLFEAVYGNRSHWGFGLGLEGSYTFWQNDYAALSFHANSDYRQLFTNTEKRTFGLKNVSLLDQYRITATAPLNSNTSSGTVQGVPAANILTMAVDITPGIQLDNVAGFTYAYGGLTLDLGYNLYYRDSEGIKMRNVWNNGNPQYVFLTDQKNSNKESAAEIRFGNGGTTILTPSNTEPRVAYIVSDSIDFDAPRTPSQMTHKILLGAGYIFKNWEYPLMLGAGGHYEMAQDNAAVNSWGFYLKTGISF